MGKSDRVYWKRREGSDAAYISGMCLSGDVPEYGDVSEEALPTGIRITPWENGGRTIVSPPVLGTSFAYRYVLHLSPGHREEIAEWSAYRIQTAMNLQKTRAPEPGSARENWWWYAKETFSYAQSDRTPLRLMKKWKGPMLEILLEGHPRKEELLAEWTHRLDQHNASVRRNAAPAAAKKVEHELVVLPNPLQFEGGKTRQVFRFERVERGGRRAKYVLTVGSLRHKVAHGKAMSIASGTAEGDGIAAPMRLAIAILAWAETRAPSRHAILGAEGKFQALAAQARAEMEDWFARARARRDAPRDRLQVKAAIQALDDFGPRPLRETSSGMEEAARARIAEAVAEARLALLNLDNRIRDARPDDA